MERLKEYFGRYNAISQYAEYDCGENRAIVARLDARMDRLPARFVAEAAAIGMSATVTALRDDYIMFLKLNYKASCSPTDREAATEAELELRRRQRKAIELLRTYIPGFEKAFIARSSPTLCIRRGRCIKCDKDLTIDEITSGAHFDDDIGVYGFHDESPRYLINNGGTYGFPYRMLLPVGLENVYATGMMLTSDFHAHMSTRNTVACMVQSQAAGTAAALCSKYGCSSRDLKYADLRKTLLDAGVFLGRVE